MTFFIKKAYAELEFEFSRLSTFSTFRSSTTAILHPVSLVSLTSSDRRHPEASFEAVLCTFDPVEIVVLTFKPFKNLNIQHHPTHPKFLWKFFVVFVVFVDFVLISKIWISRVPSHPQLHQSRLFCGQFCEKIWRIAHKSFWFIWGKVFTNSFSQCENWKHSLTAYAYLNISMKRSL